MKSSIQQLFQKYPEACARFSKVEVDAALAVPLKLFEMNWTVSCNVFLRRAIRRAKLKDYAGIALERLEQAHPDYASASPVFKEFVIKKALSSELGVLNADNPSKTQLIYPQYPHLLKAMNFFFALNSSEFPSRLSKEDEVIMKEVRAFKEMALKDVRHPGFERRKAS